MERGESSAYTKYRPLTEIVETIAKRQAAKKRVLKDESNGR